MSGWQRMQDARLLAQLTELSFLLADSSCPPSDSTLFVAKMLLDGLSATYSLVCSCVQPLGERRPFRALALRNLFFLTDALMLSAIGATGGIHLCDGSVLLRR